MLPTVHFQFPAVFDGAPRYLKIIRLAGYEFAVVLARRGHGQYAGGDVTLRGHFVYRAFEASTALSPCDDRRGSGTSRFALELNDFSS
ncbi:hypothetical protein TNCT_441241 [Trichonephila clavata]|uniref:Uncharacterized protein n=1 Tax=Trichonephila clavata TaxID=2740835 RepID=A0A8X6FXQ6_TRICU|nr:hypothetical protein TNCT_441241 [Trichonephila clavata]